MLLNLVAALCVVLSCSATVVYAQDQKKGVIESHSGERQQDSGDLLAPFHDEMAHRGFAASSVMSHLVSSRDSMTGDALDAAKIDKAARSIDEGKQAYIGGSMEAAVDSSSAGLDLLMSKPATVARQPELRDAVYLAHVYLALAYNRLGKAKLARHYVEEFLRSFPDREVSSRRFGPEAADLFRKAGSDIREAKPGRLSVRVDDPEVVVFINERYVGVGSVVKTMLPGRSRVYTQKGARPGRVHWVTIESSQSAELKIASDEDQRLATGQDYASFVYDNREAQSQLQMKDALELAAATGLEEIAVVGPLSSDVVSTLYDLRTKEIRRRGSIRTPRGGAPSPRTLRALAAFIAGDLPSAQVRVLVDAEPTGKSLPKLQRDNSQQVPRGQGISRAWRYAAWGLGVASVGAGVYLLSVHGEKLDRFNADGEQLKRRTQTGGIALCSVGAALIASGFYLWTKEQRDTPSVSLYFSNGTTERWVGLRGTF